MKHWDARRREVYIVPTSARHYQVMLRCVCAVALLCAALAHADPEKRAEMSPVPFVLGSRYGRSPPRMLAPRNDRFFMGSRYGKRSDSRLGRDEPTRAELPSREQSRAELQSHAEFQSHGEPSRATGALLCEATGVFQLYRCTPDRRYDERYLRRNEGDTGIGDEE